MNDFFNISQEFPKKWIFRGQENSSWTLQTSLEREVENTIKKTKNIIPTKIQELIDLKAKKIEEYYTIENSDEYRVIQHFKRNTKTIFTSNIDALCSMQHFGAKTRLLDFSFSIGIALFFAIENKSIENNDRCIWCINTSPITTQIVRKNPDIFEDMKNLYGIDENDMDVLYYFLKYQEGYNFQKCLTKEAEKYITENDEIPFDASVYPVNLQGNNDRINIQNGLFLFPTNLQRTFCDNLCSSLTSEKEGIIITNDEISKLGQQETIPVNKLIEKIKDKDEPYIIQLRIPNSMREQFMNMCQWFNISTHTIYPDMEGAARSASYCIPKF